MKKLKKNLPLKIVVFIFILSSVITIIGRQSQINNKKQELNTLQNELTIQNIKTEQLKELSEEEKKILNQENLKNIARKNLGYVNPNERVFVNISK